MSTQTVAVAASLLGKRRWLNSSKRERRQFSAMGVAVRWSKSQEVERLLNLERELAVAKEKLAAKVR